MKKIGSEIELFSFSENLCHLKMSFGKHLKLGGLKES
jgi:cytochrome c-type biogenesis protein CcmE